VVGAGNRYLVFKLNRRRKLNRRSMTQVTDRRSLVG